MFTKTYLTQLTILRLLDRIFSVVNSDNRDFTKLLMRFFGIHNLVGSSYIILIIHEKPMQKNSTIDRRVLCPCGVTLVHTYVFQSTSICQYITLKDY
jgi:hypothetical protein